MCGHRTSRSITHTHASQTVHVYVGKQRPPEQHITRKTEALLRAWQFKLTHRTEASANSQCTCIHSEQAIYRLTDPQPGVAATKITAAICVRKVNVQKTLQFTSNLTVCCVLHRSTSRMIHRIECVSFTTLKRV